MSDCSIKLFGMRIPFQSLREEERDDEKVNSTNSTSQDDKLPKDPSTPLQTEHSKPSTNSPNQEEESNNTNEKNDKSLLKKPDKILPCPRCQSMETKFCYYNNYNVHQPRHFCKNCQRYWTAGGSMRNVPVGAGRRKSKSNFPSVNGSHFYPNLPNPILQSNTINSTISNNSSVVLNFGDENSSISSFEGPKCKDEDKIINKSNLEGSNGMNGATSLPYMWGPVPVPVQMYPYWGCVPVPWNNGGWAVPWSNGVCAVPGTLGKHSRDEIAPNCRETDCTKERNNNIWVPKTLRIDNPEEAAKSSIWTLVGGQNEKSEKHGGKIAKMFEGKGDNGFKNSPLLMSNPAALARSANFHECA